MAFTVCELKQKQKAMSRGCAVKSTFIQPIVLLLLQKGLTYFLWQTIDNKIQLH